MNNDVLVALLVSIPAFILIAFTIVDIARRRDLTGARKLGWLAASILLPGVGTFLYLVARPFADPGRDLGEGNDRIAHIVRSIERRERGELDDAELAATKERLLAAMAAGTDVK